MPETLTFLFPIELIGTIAFACSGAMVAIRKQLDLLGVLVLGVITAVGGGMLRDILIGITPPALFRNPVYTLTAALSVFILFLFVKSRRMSVEQLSSGTYERVMNLLDAIGLGIFTVVGIDTAVAAGYDDYRFLIIFLGVITGVGGGILRDILAGQTPAVLRRHVYACASIAGAIAYVILLPVIAPGWAMIISVFLVIMIRVLARRYKWNLPTAL
ncbi:MAG: trimeric intracellular cation channel family protein [Lachnospiraceae bacterium]